MAVKVKIGSTNYDFFNSVTIHSKFGHISSGFSLSALYEEENPVHREIFKPLQYRTVKIDSERNERLITGTGLNSKFVAKSTTAKTVLSGYGLSGVIQDCSIPTSIYPLQFNGLTIRQIATKVLAPFGISLTVSNDSGITDEVIEEVTAGVGETVSQFLTTLVAQRNLIITNNEYGGIEITRPNINQRPIATYREETPALEISLSVNGAAIHSEITTMKQADIVGENSAESVVSNPNVPLFRPIIKMQNVGNDNQTEDAAKNIRSNELRNIRLTIKSDRTTWLNGNNSNRVETIRPNNIISVISPRNYIYKRTSFFVEEVDLNFNSESETAILRCVLPEVYSNEEPKFKF